jgi:hypothetical protein
MGGTCSKHDRKENVCKILVGTPESKRPLGRTEIGWEDNIRMYLKRNMAGRCGLHSSDSGQKSVAGCSEHGNKPSGSVNGGKFLD